MPTLFPEPDSPTIPSTSPFSSVMLTPSTARTIPPLDGNETDRFSISSSGIGIDFALSLELGIERVAQSVAHQVEGQHSDENGEARERDHPPGPQHEFARVRQHGSPFRQ